MRLEVRYSDAFLSHHQRFHIRKKIIQADKREPYQLHSEDDSYIMDREKGLIYVKPEAKPTGYLYQDQPSFDKIFKSLLTSKFATQLNKLDEKFIFDVPTQTEFPEDKEWKNEIDTKIESIQKRKKKKNTLSQDDANNENKHNADNQSHAPAKEFFDINKINEFNIRNEKKFVITDYPYEDYFSQAIEAGHAAFVTVCKEHKGEIQHLIAFSQYLKKVYLDKLNLQRKLITKNPYFKFSESSDQSILIAYLKRLKHLLEHELKLKNAPGDLSQACAENFTIQDRPAIATVMPIYQSIFQGAHTYYKQPDENFYILIDVPQSSFTAQYDKHMLVHVKNSGSVVLNDDIDTTVKMTGHGFKSTLFNEDNQEKFKENMEKVVRDYIIAQINKNSEVYIRDNQIDKKKVQENLPPISLGMLFPNYALTSNLLDNDFKKELTVALNQKKLVEETYKALTEFKKQKIKLTINNQEIAIRPNYIDINDLFAERKTFITTLNACITDKTDKFLIDAKRQINEIAFPTENNQNWHKLHMNALVECVVARLDGFSCGVSTFGNDSKILEIYVDALQIYYDTHQALLTINDDMENKKEFASIYAQLYLSRHFHVLAALEGPGDEETQLHCLPEFIVQEIKTMQQREKLINLDSLANVPPFDELLANTRINRKDEALFNNEYNTFKTIRNSSQQSVNFNNEKDEKNASDKTDNDDQNELSPLQKTVVKLKALILAPGLNSQGSGFFGTSFTPKGIRQMRQYCKDDAKAHEHINHLDMLASLSKKRLTKSGVSRHYVTSQVYDLILQMHLYIEENKNLRSKLNKEKYKPEQIAFFSSMQSRIDLLQEALNQVVSLKNPKVEELIFRPRINQ